jgi:hypothetical protein
VKNDRCLTPCLIGFETLQSWLFNPETELMPLLSPEPNQTFDVNGTTYFSGSDRVIAPEPSLEDRESLIRRGCTDADAELGASAT